MITIDLSGKNALITGGTRGIGRAISYKLAEAGASTSAAFRADAETAHLSLRERQSFGVGTHRNYHADVGVADEINTLAERVAADFDGRVDILVLNAAAQGGSKVGEIDPAVWQRAFDVNLTGPFLLVQALLPCIPSGGSIVTIASGAGHDAMSGGFATYGATKAGLIMFTQDLAQDVGPRGIRANVVSPGSTDTSFGVASAHGDRKPREVGHNALRRVGVPDDVAGVVLFLCSDLAGFVTGQVVRVNGAAT